MLLKVGAASYIELDQPFEPKMQRAVSHGVISGDPTRYEGLDILSATKLALKTRQHAMTAGEIADELVAGGIGKTRQRILQSLPQQAHAGELHREGELYGLKSWKNDRGKFNSP